MFICCMKCRDSRGYRIAKSAEKSQKKKSWDRVPNQAMESQPSHRGEGDGLTDSPVSISSSEDVTKQYEDAVERLPNSITKHDEVLLYLYQTQNEDFVRRTMSHMTHLWINGSVPEKNQKNLLDKAVSYCLEKSESSHSIMFYHYTMSSETRRILSPGLRKCSSIRLEECDLTPSWSEGLHSVITTSQSLVKLDLSSTVLMDSGVKRLCEGLRHPDCKLQLLGLDSCGLTPSCCEDLSSVLATHRSLVRLNLSENDLQDAGVKSLCEGLMQSDSILQELRLLGCGLTSSCCEDIRSVMLTKQSLIKLDLSQNKLLDTGVRSLCKVLRHPHCTLEDLRLCDCGQTPFRFDTLYSSMTTNRDLTKLDLSYTSMGDIRLKCLCAGLRHADCFLQELRLERCDLMLPFCGDLLSLITYRCLIKVDLSLNYVRDSGVKRLCEGLRYPGCVLQELDLMRCKLTSSCCEDLRSAMITNRSLIKLYLSLNNLQDSGVKSLCEGLKHPDCTLQELRLERCGLTSSCCEDLRSVIITNRSMIKLDLSHNNLQDSGLKRLCEGLMHPDCVLQELRLCHCNLTVSCIEELLRIANQYLTKLDLSCNISQDSGITCPHCNPHF